MTPVCGDKIDVLDHGFVRHAQYEIRVYADAMLELVRGVAPVAVAAWESCR